MSSSSRASIEKQPSLEKVEEAKLNALSNPEDAYDPKFVKRTIRKVDFRLLPILGALYAFSLIDRTNISLARVVGAQQELGLDIGARYSIIALVFFIPYILLELPSNILLRKFGCRVWLGTISTIWGATMLAMGFVHSWQALAGCRVILGVLEAGFFPGCVYLITCWYTRNEVQTRLATFYLLSDLVGGFSPIFAYGVSTIGVAFGLQAWRWIFIICGILTCFFGLLSYFLIVDFPDKAKFLTAEQTKLIRDRVDYDRGDSVPDKLTWAKAGSYALDLKIWAFALMFMTSTLPSYAFSFFLPTLLTGMGYSVKDSQILMSPPYAFAVVTGLALAVLADKLNKRGPFIIFQALVTIAGLSMIAFAEGNATRYAGSFLGLFGCQSNIPSVLAYQSNNIVGQSKRAFASALVVGFGGVGGIIASVAFREQDAPKYIPGLWVSIGSQILMIACCLLCTAWFMYRNNQVRRGTSSKPIEGTEGFLFTL
ncbi:MFS general substrate transporter [Exidia glandulosa HHB12029]|uniref:MFS general substrate transporter n=1 Tax=Exidia glandulosa HHB12029 TaxID=1314781 RepID=A0A165PXR4_EXIGL|nr:MFS general substrate transporter [Exidia glandulosa HHB12029]